MSISHCFRPRERTLSQFNLCQTTTNNYDYFRLFDDNDHHEFYNPHDHYDIHEIYFNNNNNYIFKYDDYNQLYKRYDNYQFTNHDDVNPDDDQWLC